MEKKKNIFISHYGKDDKKVQSLKKLLEKRGYILRNSSIDSTKENEASNTDYIKKLLREGIEWAGSLLVLIGKETHTRPWVDWEIEEANRQGKRITGVYIHKESDAQLPRSFDKYGDVVVGWNSDKIISAIEGRYNNFQNPDGSNRSNNPRYNPQRSDC